LSVENELSNGGGDVGDRLKGIARISHFAMPVCSHFLPRLAKFRLLAAIALRIGERAGVDANATARPRHGFL
jgi:hypothetical protein